MDDDNKRLLKVCRTCSAEKENLLYVPLYEGYNSCEKLHQHILFEINAFDLMIYRNDGLPQQICSNCISNFGFLSQYRKECKDAQVALRSIFGTMKIEVEEVMIPPFDLKEDIEDFGQEPGQLSPLEIEMVDVSFQSSDDEVDQFLKTASDPVGRKKRAKNSIKKNKVNENEVSSPTAKNGKGKKNEPKFKSSLNKRKQNANAENQTKNKNKARSRKRNYNDDVEVKDELKEEFKESPGKEVLEEEVTLNFEDSSDNFEPDDTANSESDSSYDSTCKQPQKLKRTSPGKAKNTSGDSMTYPCKYCDKQFRTERSLGLHIKVCPERNTDLPCQICTVEFDTHELLQKHMLEVHPDGGEPTCPFCSKTFEDAPKRDWHIKQTHAAPGQYQCDDCGKMFKSKLRMQHHYNRYHVPVDKECKICHERFSSNDKYRYHIYTHPENMKFKCEVCEKPFYNRSYLQKHGLSHTREKPFLCSECGRSFRNKFAFDDHIKKHLNVRNIPCLQCNEKFVTRKQLNSHKRLHNPNKLSCDLCDAKFLYKTELESHKYKEHNIEVSNEPTRAKVPHPFKCLQCPKTFAVLDSMTKHMKVHTEERKHVCSHCGNTYKRSDHLNLHIKKAHLGITRFKCEICGRGFLEKCTLTKHYVVHSQEKPFTCSLCPASFKSQRTLRDHQRWHEGERLYACGVCEMRFYNRTAAALHTKKVHTDVQNKYMQNVVRKEFAEVFNQTLDEDTVKEEGNKTQFGIIEITVHESIDD